MKAAVQCLFPYGWTSSLIGEPKSYSVSENHIPTPKTAYGITKLASEHYLRLYFELYGINYTI